jgi:hypothetical protein
MIYYTKFNTFEILDGGDNMIMVEGVVVDSIEKAKKVCHLIEERKIQNERKSQNEIWYCCLAA